MALKLDDKLLIKNKIYKTIGIDSYKLNNSYEKTKRWTSFTLKSDTGKLWITKGIGKNYRLWMPATKNIVKSLKDCKLNLEFTGIANIEFKGNPGFSTPLAELLLFENATEFFAIERFFGKNVETYYYLGKIIKEKLKVVK
jgi:hypothetical protein